MGCLDDGRFSVELENGVSIGCDEVGLGKEGNDATAIEDAVKLLLLGLGEDINREGLRKTPLRVAKALREGTRVERLIPGHKGIFNPMRQLLDAFSFCIASFLCSHAVGVGRLLLSTGVAHYSCHEYVCLFTGEREGYRQKVKDIVQGALFPEAGLDNRVGHAGGACGLVIVRDLDLFSYCESCLLPFQVKCHVGYVPSGERVVGLSKLSRVADVFAKRLQEPQRLANEVCSALHQGIKPAGVAVILQCTHIHFPDIESVFLDSNHQGWVKILVSSGSGVFENKNADSWADFFSLLKFRGINVEKIHCRGSSDQCWCPSHSSLSAKASSKIGSVNPAMVTAVSSIIKSLGEDPLRKELRGTPSRFVKWLMNFQNSNFNMNLNGFLRGGGTEKDSLNADNKEVNSNDKKVHAELNLPFWSQCEHHLLPFHGVVHIGYLPSDGSNPIGKPLLQSIVHFYGFKLQVQERLTRQIAETISPLLGGDVIVVAEASHTCMISRGIEKFGSSTATIAVLGRFSTDMATRASFLQGIPSPTSSSSGEQ